MQIRRERTVCEWAGVEPVPPAPGSKVGLALETIGRTPINGRRHQPTETTNGWYLWCGDELASDPGFVGTSDKQQHGRSR